PPRTFTLSLHDALPILHGLFDKPSIINNVISLASVPLILARGAHYYKDFGMGRSRGSLPLQLAGNIRHGGLVEKAFGVTLRELIDRKSTRLNSSHVKIS